MRSNPYSTCTTFVRTENIRDWIEFSSTIDKRRWKMADLPMFIFCATKGNGFILPDITACYRVLINSASHGNPQKMLTFRDSGAHIRLRLIKELSIPHSSERILKSWVFRQIRKALRLKEYVSKRRLKFYWKFYWKGHEHPKPILFIVLFGRLRCFCWFNQIIHSKRWL